MKKLRLAYIILFFALLIIIPLKNLSFGAQGSDSPAYIFLAHRISHGLPLNYQDLDLSKLSSLGEDKMVHDFSMPKRYIYNEESQLLVHNYPIGLPLFLSLGFWLSGCKEIGWYLIYFALCFSSLIFIFLVAKEFFKNIKYNFWLSLLAPLLLFSNKTFFTYLIAPPNRDIFVLSLSLIIIYLLLKQWGAELNKKTLLLIISSGIIFAFTVFSRSTAIVFILLFIFFLISKELDKKTALKKVCVFLLSFFIFFIFLLSLHCLLDGQLVSFTHLVEPQFDHLDSLNSDNLIKAKGHYARNESNLFLFSQELTKNIFALAWTGLLAFLVGLITIIKNKKYSLFILLTLWVLPTFILFSFWPNAYPRYVLPIVPAIIIICLFSLDLINRHMKDRKWLALFAMACFIVLTSGGNMYKIITRGYQYHDNHYEDAISWQDFKQINFLKKEFVQYHDPIMIADGLRLYEMADALEAQTNIQVIPIYRNEVQKIGNLISYIDYLKQNHTVIILSENLENISPYMHYNGTQRPEKCQLIAASKCQYLILN